MSINYFIILVVIFPTDILKLHDSFEYIILTIPHLRPWSAYTNEKDVLRYFQVKK